MTGYASTDYGLLPAITDVPARGLLFMFGVVVIAWWLGHRHWSLSGARETEAAYGGSR